MSSSPPDALHVAVDCRVVSPHYPGIGRATLETVRALIARDDAPFLSLVVASRPSDALLDLIGDRVRLYSLASSPRSPLDQWALPRLLHEIKPAVYHAAYYAVPAFLPGRVVVNIFDVIPRLFPAYWPNPVSRGVIDAWLALAARRATLILTPSESTAHDVARLWPGAKSKVRTASLGVAPRLASTAAEAGDRPYLLYVGSNKPHKNLTRLVEAFGSIASTTHGDLVIAGAWDARYPQPLDRARRLGLGGRVRFIHRPSDEQLDALYAGATGFVFPSRYEGFGLPVLEAMAAGLPVATTTGGSLAEVAGDAALLFSPDDEAAIARALNALLTDDALRRRLTKAGLARAAEATWARTAEQVLAVYREAAALPIGKAR